MGGHGGLNILPQKRWNVYRRDNRLRVHRDEEQHREEQQQQRHRDERQRMSSVLILLRRKKAEAQARRRQRVSAAVGDAKTQLKSFQPSTTNSSLPSSHAAWLSTLVNLSESFSSFGTVSEGVCCVPRRAARCHAAVSDHDRESTVVDNSMVRADPFLTPRGAEVTARSAAAETSNVLSSCAYEIPPNGRNSALRAVLRSESPEPLLVDPLSVVRVRLPIIACTTAATASTNCSRAPLVSSATVDAATLQCLSSAASFETGTQCFECGAQGVYQPSAAGQAYHTSWSATFERSPPHQQQQQLAKGEVEHVNFFEAEENELRRLEVRRKKYLLNAGYTPGAYSDFEGEIRKSLTQVPWYYQPPSACSMSKPPAVFSSHTTEFLDTSLRHQSQQVLKQVACDSSKAALTKQRRAATPAAVLAEEDRGEEEQGQEGELCGNGHAPGLKPTPMASGALAAVDSATSLQHVSVHFKGSSRREERHCILRKRDAWPYSESDQNKRGSGETKGKDKSSNTVGRECRKKKPRRIRKDKGTVSDTRKAEDDIECVQVMLLVQDEDECTVT